MPSPHHNYISRLLNWYSHHKRDLPWRETSDPYKIWLSEIILQQTRVEQGLPYYRKFVEHFPSVSMLANAPEQEVLRLWQGLGYYSRARNLHRCAQMVVESFKGKFPSTYNELLNLPGIGPYTAAAIASIAFGESVPVIDGNVYRVLSRYQGIDVNISDQKNRKVFEKQAATLIIGHDPSDYNQAMMELGATVCTPKIPSCSTCPLQDDCHAFRFDLQDVLPVNEKRIKVRQRYLNYFVFISNGLVLMNERQSKDIWNGLFDFYAIERASLLEEDEALMALPHSLVKQSTLIRTSIDYKHVLTHQRILARFFTIELNDLNFATQLSSNQSLKSIGIAELDTIPKPRLIERFLADEKIL